MKTRNRRLRRVLRYLVRHEDYVAKQGHSPDNYRVPRCVSREIARWFIRLDHKAGRK